MKTEVFCVEEFVTRTCVCKDSAEGCFGGENCHRSDIGLDLRPVFQRLGAEASTQEQHTRRRSIGGDGGENRFWAVATPF